MIKAHDSNPWQIIRQKGLIPIGNIQSPFFIGTILSKEPRIINAWQGKNISWYNRCLNIAMTIVL